MDVIKGPLSAKLMDFSYSVGFILAKGYFNNLTPPDVRPLLDNAISLLEEASKEPSFSRAFVSLQWEYESGVTCSYDSYKSKQENQ